MTTMMSHVHGEYREQREERCIMGLPQQSGPIAAELWDFQ